MGRDCTSSLVDDLRSAAPTEHSQWLTEAEEPAFRALLHARYGGTYSYPVLYEPGGASRLWRSGRLLSLGELNAQGAIVSHTGLWAAPGRDSVDSGLSLTHPSQRTAMARDEHARMWRYLLDKLRGHVGFVHQHTSTRRPGAPRRGRRHAGRAGAGARRAAPGARPENPGTPDPWPEEVSMSPMMDALEEGERHGGHPSHLPGAVRGR
jgi:hypothetical protein